MRGRSVDVVTAQVEEDTGSNDIADVLALLALLEASFGDPDIMSTARWVLHHLRQGAGGFAVFHLGFTSVVGKLKCNNEAK